MSRVMYWTGIICLLCMVQACTKEEDKTGSIRNLLGVWVDIDHPADTLVISKAEIGLVLFDNSMAFRSNQVITQSKQDFSSFIRFNNQGIEVARYHAGNGLPDYRPFSFQWLKKGSKFTIAGDSFRPFLNCSGCSLTYSRVK
jgi:hypothetical protein